ncbi:hemin uptake protein HemP [Azospirillum griseum]|uniref:Hemin uptake protein HemP n=1 Tax=Azospirillum griseum TaxID=2496639 RepID=A0A431VF92_9PROT|nr:hemin uptake protein HemP [Azospirillum griseum]RTR18377.1 hemin uptake protein HemP [Azospirillum griseum]
MQQAAAAPSAGPALSLPIVESAGLMAGSREIVIQHAGQSYRLRVTRANKLILTK